MAIHPAARCRSEPAIRMVKVTFRENPCIDMEEDVMEQQIMQPQTNAGAAQEQRHPIAIEAIDLVKDYGHGENAVHALRGVNVRFEQGRFTAIMGPSGSGKSTLMHTLAGLDSATSGHIVFDGADITTMNDNQLTMLRRHKIGFIFQSFNLLPMFTAEQNILMPLTLAGQKPDRQWFDMLTTTLGLKERLTHRPNELSGGQQQRVAIARALIGDPEVLLCDEATSALDPRTTRSILALLKDLNARLGLTIVLITHQMQVVKDICTDLAVMSHGKVVDDGSILDVFDHPSNELTREFIYTSGNMNKGITLVQEHPLFSKERESGSVYLLFSVGSGAEETLMADVREWFGVRGNIMFGNVDVIHGTPVGMILVSLDGPAEAVSKALAYFPTVGVSATPLADLHVNEVEENDNE